MNGSAPEEASNTTGVPAEKISEPSG